MKKSLRTLRGEELGDLLLNHGVLHEVNRTFFNPLGLILVLDKDFVLTLREADKSEVGIIMNTVDKFSIKAFLNLCKERHQKRHKTAGFIIQTQDMLRNEKLKIPITPPSTLKLQVLLKQVDNFTYEVKKRLMEKSKDYDTDLTNLDDDTLSYDMFEDLQNDRFIDGVARAMMLKNIKHLNDEIKKIREIAKNQKEIYKEKK